VAGVITALEPPCARPATPVPPASVGSYCIFQEPWWLDAVAPGTWQSLELSRGGELVARMPIVYSRKYGLRIVREPPLTPTLGPWIRTSAAARPKRIAEEKEIFTQLIDRLPNTDYLQIHFNHRITNWLPFYWRRFDQTTRYTYILNDVSDMDTVWRGLQESVRRNIRKAERQLLVRTDPPLDRLLNVVEATYTRQHRRLPFRRDLLYRIDEACAARNARRMLFAEDAGGRVHAVAYLVLDSEFVYYLIGGADPELRGSGAQNLLLWNAIAIASQLGLRFDFEGSMVESIERVFRSFGAVQVPYLRIYRANPVLKALLLTSPRLTARLAEHIS
jgi:Acetyltransferase (GNAT) domain